MPKTFFKRLPKFAFIGEKSTKLATLTAKKTVFSNVFSFNEVALWEILLLEKSWA
jgi:hypothetical protein